MTQKLFSFLNQVCVGEVSELRTHWIEFAVCEGNGETESKSVDRQVVHTENRYTSQL